MTSFTNTTRNYPTGADTPIRRVRQSRAPTSTDFRNFTPGDEWLDTAANDWWKFVTFSAGAATWVKLAASPDSVDSITGDSGGIVLPALPGGNINLVGEPGQVVVTGNLSPNTLTISLAGGGTAIDEINVDASSGAGTDPVLPTASGAITVTGGQVASGTTANVIQTNSLAANTYTVQVQRSTAAASTDVDLNGVSHFDSGAFQVDANGFVQLVGGGIASESFDVDAASPPGTDPVVPDATGEIAITGGQVASGVVGANIIRTNSVAANAYTIEIQRSADAAGADSTLNGVSHFDSDAFSVDADGFVQLAGGGTAMESFTVPSGTSPVVPDASGVIDLPAGNGFAFTGGTNAMTGNMVSPFTGDFTFTDSTAADTETVTVSNTDNTAASDSGASFVASVGGTTQTGDAYNRWAIGTARSYALGPDTTDGTGDAKLKLTTTNAATATPSSGTEIFTYDPSSESYSFKVINLDQAFSRTTGVSASFRNTGTTSTSAFRMRFGTGATPGGGGGDYYIHFDDNTGSGNAFQFGVQESTHSLQIHRSPANASPNMDGTIAFQMANSGAITFGNPLSAGNFYTFPAADGSAGQTLITDGSGTLSFANSSSIFAYTDVNSSPYVVLAADEFISVDASGGAITVQMPNSTTTGRVIRVKDRTGSASSFNITVTTVGGAVNIDGATTYVIDVDRGAANFLFNGSTYEVF